MVISNSIKLPLRLMGVLVQLLSVMRRFVQYVIIIDQNWDIFTYVALLLKESTTYILYKSPHFCEDIFCTYSFPTINNKVSLMFHSHSK